MTKDEINDWLFNNELLLNKKVKLTTELITQITNVYNALTGEKKMITTCGRCIFNMISRLKAELIKIKNNYYTANIYRTNFGDLTLKETNKIAYVVFVKDQDELLVKLNFYKEKEKTIE